MGPSIHYETTLDVVPNGKTCGLLEIADHVTVTGMSLVTQSILESGVYSSGLAVEPNRTWNKISARLRRIDELARRIIALEKRASGERG